MAAKIELLKCPFCTTGNCFISINRTYMCRECGDKSGFFWEQLPSLDELKEIIYLYLNKDTEKIKELLLKRPFGHFLYDKEHGFSQENDISRTFVEYYNFLVYYKFSILPDATKTAKIPNRSEETGLQGT